MWLTVEKQTPKCFGSITGTSGIVGLCQAKKARQDGFWDLIGQHSRTDGRLWGPFAKILFIET